MRNVRRSFDAMYKRVFRNVEEGILVVRVDNMPGVFAVDVRSDILRRFVELESYEPQIVELIARNIDPERDAVDVGANIGLFTILFSKSINPGRKVLAVEPAPAALQLLRKNIARNSCSQSVLVYQGVAGIKRGYYTLNMIPGMEEYSSVGKIVHPAVHGKGNTFLRVAGDTIDHLVRKHHLTPGLLKIDAEGSEYSVLHGARSTIVRYRPFIISELSEKMLSASGTSSSMVVALLKDLGYVVISVQKPAQPLSSPYEGDIVAVHQESISSLIL